MAIVAWIISIAALLGGLALWRDVPFADAALIAQGLWAAAFIICPAFWQDAPFGITAKPRIAACVAMLLAVPLVLMRP